MRGSEGNWVKMRSWGEAVKSREEVEQKGSMRKWNFAEEWNKIKGRTKWLCEIYRRRINLMKNSCTLLEELHTERLFFCILPFVLLFCYLFLLDSFANSCLTFFFFMSELFFSLEQLPVISYWFLHPIFLSYSFPFKFPSHIFFSYFPSTLLLLSFLSLFPPLLSSPIPILPFYSPTTSLYFSFLSFYLSLLFLSFLLFLFPFPVCPFISLPFSFVLLSRIWYIQRRWVPSWRES